MEDLADLTNAILSNDCKVLSSCIEQWAGQNDLSGPIRIPQAQNPLGRVHAMDLVLLLKSQDK